MNIRKERFKLVGAVCLILRRGEEILLLQRAHTGYQDGNYGLVAGHLDGNEFGTQAAVREAWEEVGITIKPEDLRLVHVDHRLDTGISSERIELFFEATKWEGEPRNAEPGKCSGLAWCPINNLPVNIIPLVNNVLCHIAAGESYSEYKKELAHPGNLQHTVPANINADEIKR